MNAIIAHAVSDENGKAKGGKAGNQSGKELRTQEWYNREKGWSAVFRAKSKTVKEKIAKAAEQAVGNMNIGYNQADRTSLFVEAEKVKFKIEKITTKCNTDCSALVAVCLNAAGVKVSKDMYTGNEHDVILNTGRLLEYTSDDFTKSDKLLERGDILLGPGHTAIVIAERTVDKVKTEKKEEKKAEVKSDKYRVQVAACRNISSANATVTRLNYAGLAGVVVNEGGYYKVLAGTFSTRKEADDFAKKISGKFDTYVYAVKG